jgi:GH24 family phage-related lysozyme (muramidase)
MLQQSVLDAWHQFSEPLEGRIEHMYLDILGLVTCGVGVLIDPIELAVRLPWKKQDGSPATNQEVEEAWHRLKSRPELAQRHVSHALAVTGLFLSDEDIDTVVARKLAQNAEFVREHHFPEFAAFPADAQLAIMSMAWAVGPGFPAKFPHFTRAVLSGNWAGAQADCTIREEGNPGVVPRNRANRICFANAEIASRLGVSRQVLGWPNVMKPPSAPPPEHVRAIEIVSSAALEEARLHALDVTRLSALRELGDLEEPSAPDEAGENRVV